MLIDCNAMVDAQTKRGQTPLMLAAWCGNDNVCNLLLQVKNKFWHAFTILMHTFCLFIEVFGKLARCG